ncbi:hypothetical protein PFISCL1PPCAC_28052, partial [Pristionchus fissidentatus]
TMRLPVLVLLSLSFVDAFCPLQKHQVCNPGTKHSCTCAMVQSDESSAPDRSCGKVAAEDENGEFPAVSVTLDLAKEHDNDEGWPQKAIIDGLASTLRIQKDTIVLLRANCADSEEEKLIVQFSVLKKNINSTLPYDDDDFVNAESLSSRLKTMISGSKLGGLEVEKIEFVEELIDIEMDPDNSELVIIAILSAIAFGFMLVLGCCMLCRKSPDEYEDDLQKA